MKNQQHRQEHYNKAYTQRRIKIHNDMSPITSHGYKRATSLDLLQARFVHRLTEK